MLSDNFSRTLCDLRKKAQLSQEELAEQINVSRQAISKWERGEAYPDIENLIALSKLFGVTLDFLVNGTDDLAAPQTDAETTVKIAIGDAVKIEINDDNDNDEDDDEDDDPAVIESKKSFYLWYELPYSILVTVAYLLWGFLADGWTIGWTLYITIPVYDSIIDCIRTKKLYDFCYPVFVTFVYLLMGMAWGLWHPWWILFITVPVFYPLANIFDHRK